MALSSLFINKTEAMEATLCCFLVHFCIENTNYFEKNITLLFLSPLHEFIL